MNNMNKVLSGRLYLIFLCLYCIWVAIGVFPLMTYEGDAQQLVFGATAMYNSGSFTFPPSYGYMYCMQPLPAIIVTGFKYLFPFATCEQIYSVFTAISAYIMIFGCLKFVRQLTNINPLIILFALFLYPEAAAIAMYANTAAPALATFVWSLCLMNDRKYILSVVLLCLAPLFRLDILVAYPVVFAIFLNQKIPFWKSVVYSALIAIIVSVFTILGYFVLNANPFDTFNQYAEGGGDGNLVKSIAIIVTFYTFINLVTAPVGIIKLLKDRKLILFLICLIPIVILQIVNRLGTGTKHLLYILPFALLLSAITWEWIINVLEKLKQKSQMPLKVVTTLLLVCLFFFLCVSVRLNPSSRPWLNVSDSKAKLGPCLTLYQEHKSHFNVEFGFGAGEVVPTADEFMLLTGNIVYPFYIHNFKTYMTQGLNDAKIYLADKGDYNLLGLFWGDGLYFPNLLLNDGWQISGSFKRLELKNNNKVNIFVKKDIDIKSMKWKSIHTKMRGMVDNDNPSYIVTNNDSEIYLFGIMASRGYLKRCTHNCFFLNR